jgi:ABC-type Fe3+/spermidine/putrescine transport system ATPase subunit
MLDLVQLSEFENRRPHELSGGQQQRVALARALVVEPQVLLLDEPLANLDANLRLEMRKLIRSVQQATGTTMLFVTHDQEEAVMLSDRVALMMAGRLQQVGSPRELYTQPRSAAVARFFRNENLLAAHKVGSRLLTAVGELAAEEMTGSRNALPDGQVLVSVRPEQVALGTEGEENCLRACILSSVYMGTHTQVQLAIGEATWSASLGPDDVCTQGDAVWVRLPREHLWLLPPE